VHNQSTKIAKTW